MIVEDCEIRNIFNSGRRFLKMIICFKNYILYKYVRNDLLQCLVYDGDVICCVINDLLVMFGWFRFEI